MSDGSESLTTMRHHLWKIQRLRLFLTLLLLLLLSIFTPTSLEAALGQHVKLVDGRGEEETEKEGGKQSDSKPVQRLWTSKIFRSLLSRHLNDKDDKTTKQTSSAGNSGKQKRDSNPTVGALTYIRPANQLDWMKPWPLRTINSLNSLRHMLYERFTDGVGKNKFIETVAIITK